MTRTEAPREGVGEADDTPDPEDEASDPDAVRERARAIREEQVKRACSRLAARGELTPDRREAVESLADRLVERLTAAPARGDEAEASAEDPDAAATAAVLRALAEE